jgi:ParB-like nuclease domain
VSEQYPRPPAGGTGPRLDGSLARWLSPTSESRIERIAVDHVHERPWWGDDPAAEAELAALRTSIATRGIVEPLLLRHREQGGLEVVTGSRRLRMARDLGMARVPAIVRDLTDREAMLVAAWSTVERRHPSLDELSAVRARLLDAGLSAEEAGMLAGRQPAERRLEPVALGASAHTAPFRLRPLRRRHRSASSFAPFLRVSVRVLPDLTPAQQVDALAVLDAVRPMSIAT